MRILFVDQFNQLGGAQQCLLDLIDHAPPGGMDAALPGAGPLSDALRKRNVRVHELPKIDYAHGRKTTGDICSFAFDAPRMARRIQAIADERAIDLVYVNGPRLLPAAALASRDLVFHAHSFLGRRYAAAICRWSLRARRTRIIACSRFVASRLPAERLRVIYTGVRELPFRARDAEYGSLKPRIGVIGRIAPEKGQLDFVLAARALEQRDIAAEYAVYGAPLFSPPNYMKRVLESAAGLPIAFPGWADNISAAFSNLDLLAVPSSEIDAAPRVILEAFAAGVPVIAYASGGIPELIENGVTGVLTPSPDPSALADAIANLLARPEKMERMAYAARSRWEERFRVERYAREVLDFITST